jgi:hypothetical protein
MCPSGRKAFMFPAGTIVFVFNSNVVAFAVRIQKARREMILFKRSIFKVNISCKMRELLILKMECGLIYAAFCNLCFCNPLYELKEMKKLHFFTFMGFYKNNG